MDERLAIERRLRELDRLAEDLRVIEKDLARHALEDVDVQRLMTVTGIDMTVAVGIAAAIGDITRFAAADKLVSYFGLNPSVKQSGLQPAKHGRMTKQGHARAMLVEAAWAAAKAPGPLRAFFPAHPCAARPANSRRRHREKARRPRLASAEQASGLRLGTSGIARQEAARPRTQGRISQPKGRQQTRHRPRL